MSTPKIQLLGGGGDTVNPDYNENDTTSKAHILNRPFYEDESLAETYSVSSYLYAIGSIPVNSGCVTMGLATDNVPSLKELCHCYTIDGNAITGSTGATSTFSHSLSTFSVTSFSGGYFLKNSNEVVMLIYDYNTCNTEYNTSIPSNGVYLCNQYNDVQGDDGNMYSDYVTVTTLHRLPIKTLDSKYLALPVAGYNTWGAVYGEAPSTSGYNVCPILDGKVYYKNTTYSNWSLGQGYGTCSTAAATTAKTVSAYSYTLQTGGIVAVKFTYAVPANSTLNINSKGAKSIYYRGAKITDNVIQAGDIATFIYNGSYYILLSVDRWGQNMEELKAYVDETILSGAW